ncbi:tetratricopeptide repeat protein [Persicobacter sp. CCB-QB2]|uniref:tetratricopeptide repeat protein n=1 Tax=Persicobacter sp. CCB-QB2 TaxID=1561025 RepID=UPI0006A976BF|nr:tetratricopeptide repeat protein [Persicobacter sp. CCB-QB2]
MIKKLLSTLCCLWIFAPCSIAQIDARQYFTLAKGKYDIQDYTAALEYINQAIEGDSSFLNAFLLRAQIHDAKAKYSAGIKDYTYIIDQIGPNTPQSFSYLYQRAILHRKRKDLVSAEKDINQVIRLNPNYADGFAEKGYINFLQRKPKTEAIASLNKAININPNNSDFYKRRAYLYATTIDLRLGEPDLGAAIIDINKAIALSPRDNELYNIRRNYYLKSNQDDLALNDLTRSISWGEYDEKQLFERGMLFMKKGNYDLAVKDFNAAIKYKDETGQTWRYLGLAFHNKENYFKAIELFTTALDRFEKEMKKLDPKDDRDRLFRVKNLYGLTYIERGMAHIELNHLQEACYDFRQALDFSPEKANNYLNQYCEP